MSCTSPIANIPASTLNTSLIPTFLSGLTQSQQTTFIEGSSPTAVTFRYQANTFLSLLTLAKKQLAKGLVTCPFTVPWSTSSSIIINQRSMVDYYNSFFGSSGSTGFAYILRAVLKYNRTQSTFNG